MRGFVKQFVETAICASGATRLARRRRAADTLVLAYHNIVPDGEPVWGDRSLHLARRDFARQLDLLQRTHVIVPLTAIFEAGPRTRRPRAVITFDDACQGAVTVGIAELVARGLPATVFVAPAFIDGGSFWWDALSSAQDGLPDEVRRHALEALKGQHESVHQWARESGLAWHGVPPHQTCATTEQLAAIDHLPGITVASHTWSHPNLARLPEDQFAGELVRPLAWLRERFQQVIPWLAYPYGLTSPAAMKAVAAADYQGALLVEGGWIRRARLPTLDPYGLPRQNVPAGLSTRGFALRASGLRAS